MLSKRTKYGLSAMTHLSRAFQQGPVLISDLAQKEGLPQKFLEAILLDLKNKGILQSKKGKGGGYFLGRPPQEIMVGEVVRALEGPLAPVPCVSQTAYRKCDDCKEESCCGIRDVMKEVRDAIANVLDNTSFSDVINRSKNLSDKNSFNFTI